MNNELIWDLVAKKLSGEATIAELNELEQILRQDPGLHYSLEILSDMWNHQPHTEMPKAAFEKHLQRMKEKNIAFDYQENPEAMTVVISSPSRSIWRIITTVLTAILIISVVYWFSHPVKSVPPQANGSIAKSGEIITQNGTRTKLLLPDGTTVWLNAGSRLTYDSAYGNILREVSLTGEGFFDVVKNKDKPFLIHAGNINIKVLGTAFNVKFYPGDKTIETSLIRGKIEVTLRGRPMEKLILKPNQKLILNASAVSLSEEKTPTPHARMKPEISILHLHHFGSDSLVSETAWVDNTLVFQDESFSELAKKMERWYGVHIHFDDVSLDTLHFTGSFEKENINQALSALQLFTQFNFTINNGEVHIQKNK